MTYGLGVDLGTTHTAAAIHDGGRVEAVRLGSRRPEIPSVLFLQEDGGLLAGEAAERRGETDPARQAREFKRRIGDPVPIVVGGAPFSAHALTARLLRHVVDTVQRARGEAPARVVVTYPANWGPYKQDLLMQAAQLADLPGVILQSEPAAAAVRFASTARVDPGDAIAVYDLGGGTFDAAVLRKEEAGFTMLGEPSGIEQLGGIDFDEAVLDHVRVSLGTALDGLDPHDDDVQQALNRLRRDCVEAKEALSADTEALIPVALPRLHTRVRITRAEFEAMVQPTLEDTVAALHRALRSAGVTPGELRCVVLAGGSSRIPLVSELLSASLGIPVVADEQPELGIAMGAALLADPATTVAAAAPPPPPPSDGWAPLSHPGTTENLARPQPAASPRPAAAPPPLPAPPPLAMSLTGAPSDGVRKRPSRWWPVAGALAIVLAITAVFLWPRENGTDPAGGAPTESGVVTRWQVATGQPPTGAVAVAPDHIVVPGADGALRGLNRTDGAVAWTAVIGDGLTLATRVEDGIVYAATESGSLVAVTAATGRVNWRRETGARFVDRPYLQLPRVYAAGREGKLYGYHVRGDDVWRFDAGGEIVQRPVVSDSFIVVAGADGNVHGVDRDGKRVWSKRIGPVTAAPTTAGAGVCLATGGGLTCVRASDGAKPVRITAPGTALTVPSGATGVVYAAAADGSIGAWDTATAERKWHYQPGLAAPAAAQIVVNSGQVQVAYADGHLAGIDAATGDQRWQLALNDAFDDSPKGSGADLFAVGRTGVAYALTVPTSPKG